MPVQVSHPGVYIEEIPSTTRTVGGVSTSTTAFVDFFARGPVSDESSGEAVQIFSFREFVRQFGGLHTKSEASYGVKQFFDNGGQTAFVVRANVGGSASYRKLEVKIPKLVDFALDALEAARDAAEAALTAQTVVNASRAVAGAREAEVPDLSAAASTTAAAAELPAKPPATYDELAGARGSIRSVIEESQRAVDQAREAGGDVTDAQQKLDAAAADFEGIDLRKSTDKIQEAVKDSLKSAKDAATAAATAAKASDKYEERVPEDLDKTNAAVEAAVDALRHTHFISGFGAPDAATAMEAAIPPGPEGETPEALKSRTRDLKERRIRTAIAASRSAVAKARDGKAKDEDLEEAEKKISLAEKAAARIKQAPDGEKDAAVDAAVAAAKDATAEAEKAARAAADRLGEYPAQCDDLKKALGEADTKLAAAKKAREGAKDHTQTDAVSAAIKATREAKKTIGDATEKAVKLIPEDAQVDETGWPAVAKAAEVTADLTEEAAEAAVRAGDAAEAAGKVLALRVLQAEAEGGTIAEQTRKAAAGAAEAAQDAKDAAGTAAEKADRASRQVRIQPDGKERLADPKATDEANRTILEAAEAADKAAEAAAKAADQAMDAHIAAMAAGEAGAEPTLKVSAANPGIWGDNLRVRVLNGTQYKFDIEVQETKRRNGKLATVDSEVFRNLTLQDENDKTYALQVVNHQSHLIRLEYKGPVVKGARPDGDGTVGSDVLPQPLHGGADGNPPNASQLEAAMRSALENIAPNVFNILCLPITGTYSPGEASAAINAGLRYCEEKRAFMIVDIPETVITVDDMKKWMKKYGNAMNFTGAVYYPRLIIQDPLQSYRPRNTGTSGTMAGVYARTDTRRGIWKAPAGVAAVLQGAEPALKLTDTQNGKLNPLGVNVLRSFPVYGNLSWGARTLAGADQLQSEWKYVNVRRLVSYIEESLFQGLKWAVFEPNDEPLWGQIRLQVGSFLGGLFTAGAFAGGSPGDAYFVKCDKTTTTPVDIERGIVNIVIGVAPVKPAEFIILQIEQIAGLQA